ncbi:MAG: hypothetical protein IK133_07855, partial [Clostridia bacterium]|nr:hypothetical protein [Clostridia bacterium]
GEVMLPDIIDCLIRKVLSGSAQPFQCSVLFFRQVVYLLSYCKIHCFFTSFLVALILLHHYYTPFLPDIHQKKQTVSHD